MSVETDLKRVDYDPYFERWNSVMFYPSPLMRENQLLFEGHRGNGGTFPGHQHKTCFGIVKATVKYPPRVCPLCKVDTSTEVTGRETPGGVCLP